MQVKVDVTFAINNTVVQMLVAYEKMTARRKDQNVQRDYLFVKKAICETYICVVGSKYILKRSCDYIQLSVALKSNMYTVEFQNPSSLCSLPTPKLH